jgi:hypothetical protein
LVLSDRPFHALTRNFGMTQQTTSTMTCLVSRLVELYNSLICAYKKGILSGERLISARPLAGVRAIDFRQQVIFSLRKAHASQQDCELSFFFFLFPHVAPSDCQHVPAAISHSGNIYTQFFY